VPKPFPSESISSLQFFVILSLDPLFIAMSLLRVLVVGGNGFLGKACLKMSTFSLSEKADRLKARRSVKPPSEKDGKSPV